jgi:hypothetical protein
MRMRALREDQTAAADGLAGIATPRQRREPPRLHAEIEPHRRQIVLQRLHIGQHEIRGTPARRPDREIRAGGAQYGVDPLQGDELRDIFVANVRGVIECLKTGIPVRQI